MDHEENPLDAGLEAAFAARSSQSVLTQIQARTGTAPRVALQEEDSGPVIDTKSSERLSLPQGRSTYQLMGEIARGGMGVVLKGHDVDLGRDVAVKVLNKELCQHPEVLQRFVEEAQIGGQLQHPGIVPVYELGLMADERPYFSMKLVKGRTLATILAERESPGEDRRSLLDIFESVCQTVGYAHSRGVIHRDLKPANVMVGAFGEVQVVDWGLAKVLARGGRADERRARDARDKHTVLETVRSSGSKDGSGSGTDSLVGSVMGTPAYMSPEQAQGQVDKLDERSDVFSLGAILCEILTGTPPYTGEKEHTLSMAAQAETEDALQRLDGCSADPELVKLTKQCLVAAPGARPRNGGVVAERLHRHLASVEERAEAARIDAAVQRRGRVLTIALAVAILGIFGVGGTSWLWVERDRFAQREAVQSRIGDALAEAAELRARREWAEARAAVARGQALLETADVDHALGDRLAVLGADLDAEESAELERVEREAVRQDLLARLEEIRSLGRMGPATEDPTEAVEGETPDLADHGYAELFEELGFDPGVGDELGQARLLEETGSAVQLALALDDWARIREVLEPASPEARRMMRVAMMIDGDAWRTRVRTAVVDGDEEALASLAREADAASLPPQTTMVLAGALRQKGLEDEALTVLDRGVREYPSDFPLRLALGRALVDGGDRFMTRALRHLSAACALRPDSPNAANELGYALFEAGEYPEAKLALERAIAIDPGFAAPYFRLASTLHSLGLHDEERETNAQAVGLYELWLERRPDDFALMSRIANVKKNSGDPIQLAEARALYERAIELDPTNAWRYHNLSGILVDEGDIEGARALLERAIAVAPENAIAYRYLGTFLFYRGDIPAAIEMYEKSLELDPEDAWTLVDLGRTLRLSGSARDGIEYVRRGLEANPEYAYGWGELARHQAALAAPQEALESYKRQVELDPRDTDIHFEIAELHRQFGHFERAIDSYERVIELSATADISRNQLAWLFLTVPREDLRDPERAVELAREAVELEPENPTYLNTLGLALYRSGAWDESLEFLDRSMQFSNGGVPSDWLFVAMSYARLGDLEEARSWLERTTAYARSNPLSDVQRGFLAEAEAVLEGAQ